MMIHSSRVFPDAYLLEINETLKYWAELIKTGQNVVFTKYGDGELICMKGHYGDPGNCDGHPYSRALGDRLIDAWHFFTKSSIPNIYMGEWADQPNSNLPSGYMPSRDLRKPLHQYIEELLKAAEPYNFKLSNYEILLQNTISEEKMELFKTIKESPREKIFVGPSRLTEAMGFLNMQHHVEVPLINSYAQFDKIVAKCKHYANNGSIFMISSGMPAKVLIKELLCYNSNISCLDFGSSFDAIFVGSTREGQPDTTTLRRIYHHLL